MTRDHRAPRLHEVLVPVEWIDFNGHVNDSRHFQMTSETADRFMEMIGADADHRANGHSWFTVESHVRFHAQAYLGDRLEGAPQLLDHDHKRVHLWCTVWRGDTLICSAEHVLLHVDTTAERVVPVPPPMLERLDELARSHSTLARPETEVLPTRRGRR